MKPIESYTRKELMIVGALALLKRASVVQIQALIPGNWFPVSIYPEIIGLERDGVVASDWGDGPPPRRRIYWLKQGEAS